MNKRKNIVTPGEVRCGVTDPSIVFSLTCFNCDAGMDVESADDALAKGWKHVQPDDGPSWSYLGDCPVCIADTEAIA